MLLVSILPRRRRVHLSVLPSSPSSCLVSDKKKKKTKRTRFGAIDLGSRFRPTVSQMKRRTTGEKTEWPCYRGLPLHVVFLCGVPVDCHIARRKMKEKCERESITKLKSGAGNNVIQKWSVKLFFVFFLLYYLMNTIKPRL